MFVSPLAGEHASNRRHAFGRRLQAAREHRGVSLEEIAQATKVNASMLSALERGDASKWPKGLFRRAFFRDYVAAIGLPVDANIREFLDLFPDGEDHPVAPAVPAIIPAAAPALRLSLAPRAGWRIPLADLRQEGFAALAVCLLALLVTLSVEGSLLTFLAVSGLGYSSRVAMLVIRRISALARRHRADREPHRAGDHQSVGL